MTCSTRVRYRFGQTHQQIGLTPVVVAVRHPAPSARSHPSPGPKYDSRRCQFPICGSGMSICRLGRQRITSFATSAVWRQLDRLRLSDRLGCPIRRR
jgi:hypothetical protein